MTASARPVKLIVLGVRERGDDGAALGALALLPADVLAQCDVHRAGGLDVLELIDLPPGRRCVIADAALGLVPGTVRTLGLGDLADAVAPGPVPRSSHELPIRDVLRLAALMRGEPPSGWAVVMGGERFALGEGLSPRVAAGLPAFAAALSDAIRGAA